MNNKKSLLLFVIGTICLTWGIVSFYVEQGFTVLTIALSLSGLLSLLICFIHKDKSSQRHLKSPQWKRAGIILTAIFLSAVFSAGINYFAYSLPFRWDVTQAKQHTLTTSTIEFLKGLNSQVQLTALYVGLPPKYLKDLFNEYERVSNGKLKAEIIDPIEQIGYAAQYGSVISNKERKVIVRAGN